MAEHLRLVASGLLSLALMGSASADEPIAAAAEARQLSILGAAAQRHGSRLTLRAANGQVVNFDSRNPPGNDEDELDIADYRLTGISPDGRFFVVRGVFYEHHATYWVSREAGDLTEFHATPEVSPNGRFAIEAVADESALGVFVWEITGDRPLQRAHLRHADYGLFTFKRWLGNGDAELALYSHSFLDFCPNAQATTATVHLRRSGQDWSIEPPANAHEVHCD